VLNGHVVANHDTFANGYALPNGHMRADDGMRHNAGKRLNLRKRPDGHRVIDNTQRKRRLFLTRMRQSQNPTYEHYI
jgi:hypothetical protein